MCLPCVIKVNRSSMQPGEMDGSATPDSQVAAMGTKVNIDETVTPMMETRTNTLMYSEWRRGSRRPAGAAQVASNNDRRAQTQEAAEKVPASMTCNSLAERLLVCMKICDQSVHPRGTVDFRWMDGRAVRNSWKDRVWTEQGCKSPSEYTSSGQLRLTVFTRQSETSMLRRLCEGGRTVVYRCNVPQPVNTSASSIVAGQRNAHQG
ncbi:hypothetical protein CBL_04549 [Carabus blaptoides fortunei]